MKRFSNIAYTGIELMGEDFLVTIEFAFIPGRPMSWCRSIGIWDPPEPDEFEIESIVLQRDESGRLGAPWELDGSMFEVIADLDAVQNAMMEAGQ